MYHINSYRYFLRFRTFRYSTSKNLNIKSVDSAADSSTKPAEFEVTSKKEFISPLYTQKVGMFSKPGLLFNDDVKSRTRAYIFYGISFVSFFVLVTMIKIIPPGHVGIVERKNGKIDQFNNKGRLALFHIPFLEKPVAFRITPIRKKIVRTCMTSDSKKLEVVVFLTLTAKLAFASHIYSIFGVNYTKGFVEKELNFDIDQVIKKFKLEDLLFTSESAETLEFKKGDVYSINSSIEKANSEMIQRFEDAGIFNKIEVSDVVSNYGVKCVQNISYRRPDLTTIPA